MSADGRVLIIEALQNIDKANIETLVTPSQKVITDKMNGQDCEFIIWALSEIKNSFINLKSINDFYVLYFHNLITF